MSFKVAASDFDGTLYRNEKISASDIAAINAWRKAGNKFGIVTGRPLIMLEPYLKNFGVEVDFTVCGNGAIIHGDDGRIIFESELPKKILRAIVKEPAVAKSFHFLFETSDDMFCVVNDESTWVLREKLRWDFPLTLIDSAKVIDCLPPINQFALGFVTPEEAQVAVDVLNKKFGDTIAAQRNFNSVDIIAAGINKAQGVENLLRLMNWRGKIFVIGDESNDLPMIKKFGGYTVSGAKDFVKREAAEIFDSVGDMLNHFAEKFS